MNAYKFGGRRPIRAGPDDCKFGREQTWAATIAAYMPNYNSLSGKAMPYHECGFAGHTCTFRIAHRVERSFCNRGARDRRHRVRVALWCRIGGIPGAASSFII